MRKSTVMMILLVVFIVSAVSFAGCSSVYGPLVPVVVTGKYIEHQAVGLSPHRMVCTNLGTYRVYGPYGETDREDDITAYVSIPVNQTVYVRFNGENLWWDYKTANCCQNGAGCMQCCNTATCCCNQALPSPTPVPVPQCQCGCNSCGCGC